MYAEHRVEGEELRAVKSRNGQAGASLSDLPSKDQVSILRLLDVESQTREIVKLLSKARTGLHTAAETRDTVRIVSIKDEALALQHIAKELQLSELQLDAAELARRSERRLGVAIREGQARGEILRRGQQSDRAEAYKATDLVAKGALWGDDGHNGIFALTDDVTETQFEQAITEARAEGRLSRNNVATKCHPH